MDWKNGVVSKSKDAGARILNDIQIRRRLKGVDGSLSFTRDIIN